MKILTIPSMIYDHHVFPEGQYSLEIFPAYATIVYEYEDGVMLFPDVPIWKLDIYTTPNTFDCAFQKLRSNKVN